jgi:hypothetical protein
MGFLDDISELNAPERNKVIQDYIGHGGDEGIQKRVYFFRKRCVYVKYFLMLINVLNSNEILYYIKGSSAWFANVRHNLFSQEFLADPLNIQCENIIKYILEKHGGNMALLASFLPQNWDISIFTNTPEQTRMLIKQQLEIIKDIMINDPYIISQERVTRRKQRGETVLSIDINSNNKGADTFKGGWVSLCRTEDKHDNIYSDFDDKMVCTNEIKIDQINRVGFLIFWISIYTIPISQNLKDGDHPYNFGTNFLSKITKWLPATIFPEGLGIDANFLNLEGLALNSIFMESTGVDRRLEKKLDIDNIRLNSLLENRDPQEMLGFYKLILNIWETTFNLWSDEEMKLFFYTEYQHQDILNTIQKNILKYYITDGDNTLNNIEKYLVNLYRNTINNILMDIYDKSKSKRIEGVESIDLFIVGGDAFSRYIPTDKISDIDVKLIVTPIRKARSRSRKPPVIPLHIKNEIINFVSDIISPYIIYLNYTGKFFDRPAFRIRSYDASEQNSPYSLISLDCRGLIDVPDVGISGFFLDYAILDIAIIYNYNKEDYTKYIHNSICDGYITLPGYLLDSNNMPEKDQILPVLTDLTQVSFLPVANSLFLLEELINRYENASSVEGRFFAGKIEKDIYRYNEIKKLTDLTPVITNSNVMDPLLWYSMKLIEKVSKVVNYFGCVYAKQFDTIRLGIKKLELDFPDRWTQTWRYVIKTKTTYNSKGYIFCDYEYLDNPEENLIDLDFFMGGCLTDVLQINYSDNTMVQNSYVTLKKRVKLFCQILDKENKTQFTDIIGNLETQENINNYLGLKK